MNSRIPRRWLTDSEQRAWRSYLRGSALLAGTLNDALERSHRLSSNQYEVLVRLSEAPGRTLRMSDLAESLVYSRSRMTYAVSQLEKTGYVERHSVGGDGRAVACRLTDAGFLALENAASAHVESVLDAAVDALSPEQFIALGEAMAAIADRIEERDAR